MKFLAWRFLHVHLLLLGFMATTVRGEGGGHLALPRFNAKRVC